MYEVIREGADGQVFWIGAGGTIQEILKILKDYYTDCGISPRYEHWYGDNGHVVMTYDNGLEKILVKRKDGEDLSADDLFNS